MKKLFFIVKLFVLIAVVSCSENEIVQHQTSGQEKIDQVLFSKKPVEQKLMYTLLNENEKLALWNYKLSYIISSKSMTNQQKELIHQFKDQLTSIHFKNDSDEQIYLKNVYIPKYLKKLKKEFSISQIGELFYSVSLRGNPGFDGGDGKDCNCNRNSMVSCRWLKPESCEESKTCTATTGGCGFLGSYNCNGMCNTNV